MNMLPKSSDVNILSRSKLPTPDEIHSELPLSLDCVAQVMRHRQEVFDILDGKAEASCFNQRNYNSVKLSTVAKSVGLVKLLNFALKNGI